MKIRGRLPRLGLARILVPRIWALAPLAMGMALSPARAATTKIWVSDSAGDFSSGEARGVSVTMDGALKLSAQAKKVEGVAEASLFAAARDREGSLYLATGDAGKILRVSSAGKVETFATLPEKEVTSLAFGPDGALYAGSAPGGKVYRVESGKALLYYESKAQYLWSLAFAEGSLYVGTGLPGEIHRVTGPSKGERFHSTSDPHVRRLHVDSLGRLWAGTSGTGLVLRIGKGGTAATLYDSAKTEITAIASAADGRVWVAAGSGEASSGAGDPISASPPSVTARAARPATTRDDEDGKDKPTVTVSVSSARVAPSRPGATPSGYSSEVLLFEEGEPPRPVWTSSEELVFDLEAATDRQMVLAATGPNGKLYHLGANHWSLERTFDEKQITVLAGDAVGTNSSTALYRLTDGPREGEYVSAVKDTGRTSRFGAFRWEGDVPAGSRLEFSFRSGEAAVPDSTWSPWSEFTPAGRAASVAAPAGRYLQWKLKMASNGGSLPAVRRVEAAYRNRNAVPSVDTFTALAPSEVFARSASGSSNVFETTAPDEKGIFTSLEESKAEGTPRKLFRKGYRTLSWKASDPDGDTLSYELDFKPVASDRWVPLRKTWKETFYSFDTTAMPDGDYVFRLAASDAESNPEEKKVATRETSPIRIDNTPPAIRRVSSGAGLFDFEVADSASPLMEVEYSVDAKEWVRVEPKDTLSDSLTESYSIKLDAKSRGGFLLVRATDVARNVTAASFTAP